MEQLALTLARRSDPESSHKAADRAVSFKAGHESLIWGALELAGDYGVTQNEVPKLSPVQANRRFSAMGERGLVCRNRLGWNGTKPIYEQRLGCCVWRKAPE